MIFGCTKSCLFVHLPTNIQHSLQNSEDSKSKCKTLDQESPLSNSSGGGSQAARGRSASAPDERPATKVSTDKTKKETEVSLRLTNFVLSYV